MNNENRAFIPLWFSRNRLCDNPNCKNEVKFPYHYGSHSTRKYNHKYFGPKRKFPYHYGSHSTIETNNGYWRDDKFPYHYGSYATLEYVY